MRPNTQKKANPAPPENIDAEQSTLGSMLIEPQAIETAAALLSASDFTRPDHIALFNAIKALHERGEPADLITVPAELKAGGGLEVGVEYLMSLFDKVPTAASVGYYAKIVKEKATQRRLWELFQRLTGDAQSPDADLNKLLEQAQRGLDRITKRAGDAVTAAVKKPVPLTDRITDMADIGPPPSDLPLLWWVLTRGMIHWLSAPPGLGKSTVAYNVVTALAEGQALWGFPVNQPVKTLYVDLESGDYVLAAKLERLYQGSPRVRGGLLFLKDIRLPEEIADLVRFCQAQAVDLVVFDTAARTFRLENENDNSEVGRTITPILDAIKSAGIASFVIGHTSKSGTGARGASANEGNVDVTLSLELHRGKISDKDALVSLSVRKHKLLGFPDPLILERIGEDQFRAVDAATIPQAEPTPTASARCAADVLALLEARQDGPTRYGEIVTAMKNKGHAEATAKRVISDLQAQEDIAKTDAGYTLVDPFAD